MIQVNKVKKRSAVSRNCRHDAQLNGMNGEGKSETPYEEGP